MRAYIAVVKGPFGVSNETGSFKLDNVPPGSYTLTAWQETYGTQTQKVTVRTFPSGARNQNLMQLVWMRRGEEWYTRRQHERALKAGARLAILDWGIAVVERVDGELKHQSSS